MRQHARSSLFLLELIVAICFFSITAAICTRVFAAAHLQSIHTQDLNHAITNAQSAAEACRSTDGTLEALATLFPDEAILTDITYTTVDSPTEDSKSVDSISTMLLLYDADWNPCSDETDPADASVVYQLSVTVTAEEGLSTAHLTVTKQTNQTVLFSLDVTIHPERRLE